MVCACLPSIRGLFPGLRFSGMRSTQTGSSAKDIHGTSTNITSQHRPNLTYIKMNDISHPKGDSVEELVDSKEEDETAEGIKVRTEISVVTCKA